MNPKEFHKHLFDAKKQAEDDGKALAEAVKNAEDHITSLPIFQNATIPQMRRAWNVYVGKLTETAMAAILDAQEEHLRSVADLEANWMQKEDGEWVEKNETPNAVKGA